MSEPADVAITTVTSTLIIICIVGNSLVCAIIKRNRDMRIPINYLIVNLAVGDIMYATFVIPLVILRHTSAHPEGITGSVLCTLLTGGNLAWVGATSSVFTLTAIAIERYYAVIHPHRNSTELITRKLKVIIPGFWIFAFIINIPEFLNEEFDKEASHNFCIQVWPDGEKWVTKAYFCTCFSVVFISFILMTGLYSRVLYDLWIKRRDNDPSYRQQGVLKLRKRVTLMVVTVSAIFGICWVIDLTLHVFADVAFYSLSPDVFSVTHTLIMFNAAVNPFAYALINQRFREKLRIMICCRSNSLQKRNHPDREPQHSQSPNNTT